MSQDISKILQDLNWTLGGIRKRWYLRTAVVNHIMHALKVDPRARHAVTWMIDQELGWRRSWTY